MVLGIAWLTIKLSLNFNSPHLFAGLGSFWEPQIQGLDFKTLARLTNLLTRLIYIKEQATFLQVNENRGSIFVNNLTLNMDYFLFSKTPLPYKICGCPCCT